MIRSTRTARLLVTAVLGTAVLAGTAGCGGSMQAGAAVVVDGDRTTDGQIQSQVAQVAALQTKYGDPQPTAPDKLAREQVNWIVVAATYDKAAAAEGVAPTAADLAQTKTGMVADARQNIATQLPGFTGSDDEAIALNMMMGQQPVDIAPGGIPNLVRAQADYTALGKKFSAKAGASQTTVSADVHTAVTAASKQLKATVSPRYGEFDLANLAVTATTPAWIRTTDTAPQAPAQG